MSFISTTAKTLSTNNYAFGHMGEWRCNGAKVNHAQWNKETLCVDISLDRLGVVSVPGHEPVLSDVTTSNSHIADFILKNYRGFKLVGGAIR